MTDDNAASEPDYREHGKASARPDDDALAERTEDERVDAGLDAYNPDTVPPATDAPPDFDPELDESLREEQGTFRRQQSEGEQHPITEEQPFPPTRYEE